MQACLNWNERAKGAAVLKKVCGVLVILGGSVSCGRSERMMCAVLSVLALAGPSTRLCVVPWRPLRPKKMQNASERY